MSNKIKSGDNFTKQNVWSGRFSWTPTNTIKLQTNKHFYEKLDFPSFMNKQEIWETTAEAGEVLDKIKMVSDKIDKMTEKDAAIEEVGEVLDKIKIVNDKIDKMTEEDAANEAVDEVLDKIKMVNDKIDKMTEKDAALEATFIQSDFMNKTEVGELLDKIKMIEDKIKEKDAALEDIIERVAKPVGVMLNMIETTNAKIDAQTQVVLDIGDKIDDMDQHQKRSFESMKTVILQLCDQTDAMHRWNDGEAQSNWETTLTQKGLIEKLGDHIDAVQKWNEREANAQSAKMDKLVDMVAKLDRPSTLGSFELMTVLESPQEITTVPDPLLQIDEY